MEEYFSHVEVTSASKSSESALDNLKLRDLRIKGLLKAPRSKQSTHEKKCINSKMKSRVRQRQKAFQPAFCHRQFVHRRRQKHFEIPVAENYPQQRDRPKSIEAFN